MKIEIIKIDRPHNEEPIYAVRKTSFFGKRTYFDKNDLSWSYSYSWPGAQFRSLEAARLGLKQANNDFEVVE